MRRLRVRFIIAAMLSMFAVLGAIVAGMNIFSYIDVVETSDRELERIISNGGLYPGLGNMRFRGENASGSGVMMGRPGSGSQTPPPIPEEGGDRAAGGSQTPPPIPEEGGDPAAGGSGNDPSEGRFFRDDMRAGSSEAPYETRYFTVYFNDGSVCGTQMNNIASVSEEQAIERAEEVLLGDSDNGFSDSTYRYMISRGEGEVTLTNSKDRESLSDMADRSVSGSEADSGVSEKTAYDTMVVFVNCEKRLDAFYSSLWISLIVSVAGFIIVFLLIFISSKIIFRPVEESERKQKQFLTDASHELKTPLAIIRANTEVMELENGESKWTQSTSHQVERLSGLIEQMVALTRLDESDLAGEPVKLNLSSILREEVQSYIAPAEVSGKEIKLSAGDDIRLRANEKNIRQLIEILLDNAIKYAKTDTSIDISLKTKGRKAVMSVYNECDQINKGDNDILFERFYRTDASRNSSTGGSGIGLSVARSITERSKGRITAYSDDGHSLRITVTLPV
ncbi:MAG: GHKL domain-containing protein [Eubacterium sp.]|nr:GHKL domain-containing protein [Eubacterium sp.]